MDVFKEEQFSSAHLGHLGLVADKIDSLKIVDLIDNRLPVSEAYGAKVSHGERVAAMIMNGLGFIDKQQDVTLRKPLSECVTTIYSPANPMVVAVLRYKPL